MKTKKDLISIVVPCFNEQECILPFYNETIKYLAKIDANYEIIFVDDGSKDETLLESKKLAKKDKNVKYVSFSRNFGKEAAILAGFSYSTGDYVVTMDADLQDPPHLLPEMLKILKTQGYDSVATRRVSRKGEPVVRSFFAKMFYKIINFVSDVDIVDGARDYRLMKRKLVDTIVSLKEKERFSKGIFGWIGYKTYWMSYENVERVAGNSSWSFFKLFRYAINGIINYSNFPLLCIFYVGLIILVLSIIGLIFVGNNAIKSSAMITLCGMMLGILLLSLGIIAKYLALLITEVKQRPIFIVSETNFKEIKRG